MSGKPRNVGVYCVHREIKFLIEPLRHVQACHFRSIAEIAQRICFQAYLYRNESDPVLKIYTKFKQIPKNPRQWYYI